MIYCILAYTEPTSFIALYYYANCIYKRNFTIVSSSPSVTTITDDKGPLIRDSNWRGSRLCYNGNATMYHFKFAVPVINWPGILSAVVEPAPSRRLSWYRYPSNSMRRRACMVQVRVEVRILDYIRTVRDYPVVLNIDGASAAVPR